MTGGESGDRVPAGVRRWSAAVVAVAAAGAVLRLGAARGDLWLDEVWSIAAAGGVQSFREILTALHHDNNHYLVTAYLFVLGDGWDSLAYRLPAIAAGVGTVVLVALHPFRQDRLEALTSAVLLATSYILVHYSSEARGYAPTLFFALACYTAADRFLDTRRGRWGLIFGLSATLGLLSHLTFVFVLAGLGTWVGCEWFRGRRLEASSLAYAAVPLAVFGFLWFADVRWMQIADGPRWPVTNVLRELVRATFGLPRGPAEFLAIPLLAVVGHGLFAMARDRDPRWVLAVVPFVAALAVTLFSSRLKMIAPRYFLVSVPFFLMAMGHSLAVGFRAGRSGRAIYAATVLVFCGGGLASSAGLVRHGRGGYREAVRFIAYKTPGDAATVGSDHDWRNGLMLDYYIARELGAASERIVYLPTDRWSNFETPEKKADGAPLWYLVHDFREDPRPLQDLAGPDGQRYRLEEVFPYAGLSGWSWILYRRVDGVVDD